MVSCKLHIYHVDVAIPIQIAANGGSRLPGRLCPQDSPLHIFCAPAIALRVLFAAVQPGSCNTGVEDLIALVPITLKSGLLKHPAI